MRSEKPVFSSTTRILGAYLFTAKPGEKLPPVLANYRPLALAEAILDIQERRIKIQSGETCVTFTGVQPWKGLYEILREVNEELARVNAGIVVWKIIPRGKMASRPGSVCFLKRCQGCAMVRPWRMSAAMLMTGSQPGLCRAGGLQDQSGIAAGDADGR